MKRVAINIAFSLIFISNYGMMGLDNVTEQIDEGGVTILSVGTAISLEGTIVARTTIRYFDQEGNFTSSEATLPKCTAHICPGDQCCNKCESAISLETLNFGAVELRGEKFFCYGNTCTMHCNPLKKGEQYKVSGFLHTQKLTTGGQIYYITVDNSQKIEP